MVSCLHPNSKVHLSCRPELLSDKKGLDCKSDIASLKKQAEIAHLNNKQLSI